MLYALIFVNLLIMNFRFSQLIKTIASFKKCSSRPRKVHEIKVMRKIPKLKKIRGCFEIYRPQRISDMTVTAVAL